MNDRPQAVRATGLIKPVSTQAPNLGIVFAYGHFTYEIRSHAALRETGFVG
jgi:hypothetical protein